MIKKIFILFFVAITSITPIFSEDSPDYTGLWEGLDYKGKKIGFLFEKGGHLTILTEGSIVGGVGFSQNSNEPASIKYNYDFSHQPSFLDITMKRGNKVEEIKLVAYFLDSRRLILYGFGDSKQRPEKIDFNDSKNLVVLFRSY